LSAAGLLEAGDGDRFGDVNLTKKEHIMATKTADNLTAALTALSADIGTEVLREELAEYVSKLDAVTGLIQGCGPLSLSHSAAAAASWASNRASASATRAALLVRLRLLASTAIAFEWCNLITLTAKIALTILLRRHDALNFPADHDLATHGTRIARW
jgi:hypothetical protein